MVQTTRLSCPVLWTAETYRGKLYPGVGSAQRERRFALRGPFEELAVRPFHRDAPQPQVLVRFFSVPRLYAKFQQKVFERISPQTLDRLLRITLLKTLTGKYVMYGMGLGQVAFAASGAAPLPSDLLTWFRALGFPLTEGYGTTETGITHTAPNGESRVGWVAKPRRALRQRSPKRVRSCCAAR